ncbi:MAG: pilus assembly protein TadG-related protein [Erythrobacter sp.]
MQRLQHDITANTLAIAAASLIPLMAMVGGGVDASRYYMAAARLQNACDAGALAARQAMTTSTFTTAHQTIANTFFDQNFNDGIFGTTNRTRSYTADSSGVVTGTATANLPTTIMGAFGYTTFALRATCSAEVNVANTDVMFVLDVTGSMADCPNGSNCNSGAGSKIVALRAAVMNFYDTLAAAAPATAQVRYGIVPYSQQVNVGFSIPRQYMADTHTYQSRVASYNPAALPGLRAGDPVVVSDQTEWLPRVISNLGSTNTDHYRFRTDGTAGTQAQTACTNYGNTTQTVTVNGVNQTWYIFATPEFVLDQWSGGDSWNRAGCRARVRKTRPATATEVSPQFSQWIYCPVTTGATNPCNVNNPAGSPAGWESVNLADVYNTGNTVQMPIGANGAMTSVSWAGCIEEPDTVLTDNYSPIPANAFDININLVPSTEAQKWHPALPNAVWKREDGGGNQINNMTTANDLNRAGWACPRAARRLGTMTRSELQTYVDALAAGGNTYHDIGMVWGARFLSPNGMFSVVNNQAPNGDPISRHIIFMTDGEQVNNVENYSTHGVEWWDRRITGTGNSTTEFNRRAPASMRSAAPRSRRTSRSGWSPSGRR